MGGRYGKPLQDDADAALSWISMFKIGDSGEWVAYVSDVAAHIDETREKAQREFALTA